MPFTIFLSHSTSEADRSLFDQVRAGFRGSDIEVYIAEREFAPTAPSEKLKSAMARCGVVVVLMTRTGEHSSWINTEIGMAVQAAKPIVPLVEEGLDPSGPLRERDQIRFNRNSPGDAIDRVMRFVRSMNRPPEPEPEPDLDPFITGVVIGLAIAALVGLLIWGLSKGE